MTTLKDFRQQVRKNLEILQEREAKAGASADLKLLNQIEDHKQAIELIEDALRTELTEKSLTELKEALRPLVIANNVEALAVDEIELIRSFEYEPEMVRIPQGSFLMGRIAGENVPDPETPQHEITLPAYEIGKYSVTNEQFYEFVKKNPRLAPKKVGWNVRRQPPSKRLDHPVVGVSWDDARAYCQWLNEQTGKSYRLPTEAEWEKAARGTDGRLYPWGDEWLDGYANTTYDEARRQKVFTTAVTAHPDGVTPFGCYDIVGNVQEWTQTIWGIGSHSADFDYPYKADDGREAIDTLHPNRRVFFVLRGGPPENLNCTARSGSERDTRSPWVGFRVVREI